MLHVSGGATIVGPEADAPSKSCAPSFHIEEQDRNECASVGACSSVAELNVLGEGGLCRRQWRVCVGLCRSARNTRLEYLDSMSRISSVLATL